jgi:hypothetical protein
MVAVLERRNDACAGFGFGGETAKRAFFARFGVLFVEAGTWFASRYSSATSGNARNLKREPWNARTFIVRDPDGNLLLFAGPAT